jgi:hypothetical protein
VFHKNRDLKKRKKNKAKTPNRATKKKKYPRQKQQEKDELKSC